MELTAAGADADARPNQPPPTPTQASRATRPRRVVLTTRDRDILDSTLRLGATTADALRRLHAPALHPVTFRRRLRLLHRSELLRQTRHIGPDGNIWLYTIGPAALTPGQPRPWQPPLNQLAHTLAVGDTLLALRDLAPAVVVTGWQGEAELRGWEQPGHPRPDLCVHWQLPTAPDGAAGCGWLEVEVDRGTEGGPVWRRKLARYLTHQPAAVLLVVTTSDARARHIADTARDTGIHALTLTHQALADGGRHLVFDSRLRRRHPLDAALGGIQQQHPEDGTR